jgi:A/G-specific adenine glycosylase
MTAAVFATKIISWYRENKRDLPWRQTSDPYKIWLSEIILQQTRVAQGLPYYQQFVRTFPNISKLASASQSQVLRLWQGLGYYSRARHLHACAREIVKKYNGKFPHKYQELIKLPGIGSYTAAAIASIAFNEPVAVVDGNVFRVLARVFGLEHDVASGKGKKIFFEKANQLIDKKNPGLFNQALMEFGALHCTPQRPDCEQCIFRRNCWAHNNNKQHLLPVKNNKPQIRKRYFTYLVLSYKNKLLMRKREGKDIWRGLYDFALAESDRPFKKTFRLEAIPYAAQSVSGTYKHILSHQQLVIRFAYFPIPDLHALQGWIKKNGLKAYTPLQISKLPKPVIISRFLNDFPHVG